MHFHELVWDALRCRTELDDLRRLLGGAGELRERAALLPFFASRVHLSAFLGSYDPDVTLFDRYRHEYPLFGDFRCDLVVGDSVTRRYVFVEFEDAAPNSIFKPGKSTPEWSPRFEHGYSQIVDWFWKLHEVEHTPEFVDRFGPGARYEGLLVVGRTQALERRELRRLEWREAKCPANTRRIRCRTFDQLADDLERRLTAYTKAASSVSDAAATARPPETADSLPGPGNGTMPPEPRAGTG